MAADIQAEEDDDEGFGDFNFAPKSPSTANITIPAASASACTSSQDDDDDWSDFVAFGAAISSSQAYQDPPIPSNPTGSAKHQTAASVVTRSDSFGAQGTKPKGAIPLSIFGEEEEEDEGEEAKDEPSKVDHQTNDAVDSFRSLRGGDLGRRGSDLNDLIAGLYDWNGKSNPENGMTMGFVTASPAVHSRDLNNGAQDGLSLKLSSNELHRSVNNGSGELSEDDDWEFKVADAETGPKDENMMAKESPREVEDGAAHNPSIPFPSRNGWNLDLFVSSPDYDVVKPGMNGLTMDLVKSVKAQDGGADNLDWGFKGAETETRTKDGGEDGIHWGSNGAKPEIQLKVEGDDGVDWGFKAAETVIQFNNGGDVTDWGLHTTEAVIQFNNGGDYTDWGFKAAETETQFKDGNHKDDGQACGSSNAMGAMFDFSNEAQGPTESFAVSKWVPDRFSVSNSFLDMKTTPKIELKDVKHEMNPVDGGAGIDDESYWDFKGTNSETITGIERNEKHHGNGEKEPLPLSLFGDQDQEKENTSSHGDFFTQEPSHVTRDGSKLTSVVSINDIISNLFHQSMPNTPIVSTQNMIESALNSTWMVSEEDPAIKEDDSENWEFHEAYTATTNGPQSSDKSTRQEISDGLHSRHPVSESGPANIINIADGISWEYKNVPCTTNSADQNSVCGSIKSLKCFYTILKLDDLVEFYRNLKDELCFIALCHVDNMKKARDPVDLYGDDAKANPCDQEIQDLYDELHSNNLISKVPSHNLSSRDSNISGFLRLLEEKFQVIESEYCLSRRLALVERDSKSLVELLKHVALVLQVLRVGSAEEQSNYVSTWSIMISACARELKHGASLWRQAKEQNVSSQILSDSKGKQYILSLGEIYRAVGILRASANFYKPWILLNSTSLSGIPAMLNECSTLWSGSGLEEALLSISDPLEFPYEGTVKALVESIRHGYPLDACELQKIIFALEEPLCRLSLLTSKTVPDMKMVVWNEERFFIKLANAWANLISRDPPELPFIKIK